MNAFHSFHREHKLMHIGLLGALIGIGANRGGMCFYAAFVHTVGGVRTKGQTSIPTSNYLQSVHHGAFLFHASSV